MKVVRRVRVPPLVDIALVVKLPSLVVEAMGYFVPNHHPDAPIIQGLWKVLVVKRRLQYPRRKH